MGELFRDEREKMLSLTLWKRILAVVAQLLERTSGRDGQGDLEKLMADGQADKRIRLLLELAYKQMADGMGDRKYGT